LGLIRVARNCPVPAVAMAAPPTNRDWTKVA
jgi:hypothetical protein